jgi:hypothetical protein
LSGGCSLRIPHELTERCHNPSDSTAHTQEKPMSPDTPSPVSPVTSLDDPRVVQILSTEHWSLLSSRSLAYNEAFTRGGMFLSFLSMSFVALALLAQGMSFDMQFLTIAAVVLAFDLAIGLATYGRIMGANEDDLRAIHGMARIRHGYTQIAPVVTPYFTSATHDDVAGISLSYGNPPSAGVGLLLYGLTTSGGMIGLIVSMVGGVLAGVVGLILGLAGGWAVWIGVVGAVVVFCLLALVTTGRIPREQARLPALFPSTEERRD